MGGGPAGLFAAIALRQYDPRHEVTVYERRPSGAGGGWGVTFGAGLLADIRQADAGAAKLIEDSSYRWTGQLVDFAGEQLARPGGDGYSITRERLLDILASRAADLGVRVDHGREVTARPDADLVVACDGVNSRLRSAGRFGTSVREGVNKYLWLGATREYPAFSYLFAPAGAGLIWAYAYGTGGGRSTFVVECTPRTWHELGLDEQPVPSCLPVLERLFKDGLGGAELVCQPADRWQNFRTIQNEAWDHASVVLAGDAAHTTHFTIGSGTTLAVEDAIALATNLRDHASTGYALTAYQQQRKAALRRRRAEAHFSARWFESMDRYGDVAPPRFELLLHARRSPLQPVLPPLLFCRLHELSQQVPALTQLRRIAGTAARTVTVRRGLIRCAYMCCDPASSARPNSPSGMACSDPARRWPTRSCPPSSRSRSAGTGPALRSRC